LPRSLVIPIEISSDLRAVVRRTEQIAAGPTLWEEVVAEAVARAQPVSRAAIDRDVKANAAAAGVDPALIEAIISNESGFDVNATSRAGACGLMQLMPQTAAGLGVSDPYDPGQNVRAGTRYLRELLDRFGNVELAIAAYNAGPGAVERYGGVPPYAETRRYVRDVLAVYHVLRTRHRSRSQLGNVGMSERSHVAGMIVR
jgi:soluble lytic murein transglycosylase-like protein